ncbi:MAG: GNAT family N-acetyltransferase [Clostridia bacterium]|nr:GNAT family N-acetyltransferase [Clostridia bacterium]
MLYLKEANPGDAQKEWQFVRDMPEDENGLTNRWHGISREDFEAGVLPDMLRYARGIDLPDWMVPETFLFLWDEAEIVGQFRIRHYLNDALRDGAGHIGYFIARPYRGRGYATEGLRLTLKEAERVVPESEFYLRVNRDNPASLRVMLKNGGRIVGEDGGHYFVRIPRKG